MKKDFFEEYIKHTEPEKKEKAYAWSIGIGLQDVDGIKPSKYLIETAKQNIEGEISLEQAEKMITAYYEEKPSKDEERNKEADEVALRITRIITEPAFSFTPNEYLSIHYRLFKGIYSHAGQIREYNITKKEWILNEKSVTYGSFSELFKTLEYDLSKEKSFNYKNLNMDEIIKHLALFVSRLWQIHVFAEGNTRTTAVFFIKYLKTLGFEVGNELFSEHSWYFRNALVRANYNDLKNGVFETTEFLEKFLRNLLLGEKNILKNRDLHI